MLQQFQQMMNLMKGGADPNALMNLMGANNPAFQQAMQFCQGKSPQEIESIVRQEFQRQGMDINAVMQQLGIGGGGQPQNPNPGGYPGY